MRLNRAVLAVLLVVLALVLCACILPFVIGDDLAYLREKTAAYKVWLTNDAREGMPDAEDDGEEEPAPVKRAIVTRDYCLIGDSRTKGLNQVCGLSQSAQFAVVAESGQGYYWMVQTALWEAAATGFDEYVILMGVNDLENEDLYLDKYRSLLEEGKHLTLVTVGPVEEGRGGYSVTNFEIDKFNERLYEVEGATVIDLNAHLWKNGFSTMDGVHYTDDTYRTIGEFLFLELE